MTPSAIPLNMKIYRLFKKGPFSKEYIWPLYYEDLMQLHTQGKDVRLVLTSRREILLENSKYMSAIKRQQSIHPPIVIPLSNNLAKDTVPMIKHTWWRVSSRSKIHVTALEPFPTVEVMRDVTVSQLNRIVRSLPAGVIVFIITYLLLK